MNTLAIRSDFDFRFLGFRVLICFNLGFRFIRLLGLEAFLGFWVLGFRFWTVKNASSAQGFEHVKGYAGSDAGKRGVCSVHVLKQPPPSRVLWST